MQEVIPEYPQQQQQQALVPERLTMLMLLVSDWGKPVWKSPETSLAWDSLTEISDQTILSAEVSDDRLASFGQVLPR